MVRTVPTPGGGRLPGSRTGLRAGILGGGGRVSGTLVRIGGMRVVVAAVAYPELTPEPVIGPDFVRFTQTAGAGLAFPPPGWSRLHRS